MRFSILLFISGLIFMGCAGHSSGNFLGEAASLKYAKNNRKYHFIDISCITAYSHDSIQAQGRRHSATEHPVALALNLNFNLLSFDYTLFNQKGGLFLSIPVGIPWDIGIRPSILQWIGPAYLGAGISFMGGYYRNMQKQTNEPKPIDSPGRLDGFILWSLGGGAMFDLSKKVAFGIHATWERFALNSGGDEEITLFDIEPLNMPPYAYRNSLTNFGASLFLKRKNPIGFFIEFSLPEFIGNDGDYIFKTGTVIAY